MLVGSCNSRVSQGSFFENGFGFRVTGQGLRVSPDILHKMIRKGDTAVHSGASHFLHLQLHASGALGRAYEALASVITIRQGADADAELDTSCEVDSGCNLGAMFQF